VGIEEGSVVPVLELPPVMDGDGALGLDAATLGEMALDALMGSAENGATAHPLIDRALLEMTEKLHIGERYDAIVIDESPSTARKARRVRIDRPVRAKLQARVENAAVVASRPEDLTGVLVEADFERRTARLRTPIGAVEVVFAPDHDEAIHTALRQSSTLRGEVVYDPHTHTAKSVRLSEVVRGLEQLELGPNRYWREASLDMLAAEQGVGQVVDLAQLYDSGATDEDREGFLAAIAEIG
jgi:hypothetical protein